MPVSINIPTPLRRYTNKKRSIVVEAQTVEEALSALMERYPILSKHLLDSKGQLRRFINIYVGDEDIRALSEQCTVLEDGVELSIVPSIAGGVQ